MNSDLNDITLVGRATFCSILKLSFDLIRRYIVLYFLPRKSVLLPTNHKIRGLNGSQNGTNIHTSVPISVQVPPTNLYTSVFDFIYFRRLVESPLEAFQWRTQGESRGNCKLLKKVKVRNQCKMVFSILSRG